MESPLLSKLGTWVPSQGENAANHAGIMRKRALGSVRILLHSFTMRVFRGFHYRLYPTPEQAARLLNWEGALRVLWNAALEQRHVYLARGTRMPSYFEQVRQLTELRAEMPWLGDVPRHACDQILSDLDRAWHRRFARLSKPPRWKKKGRDVIGVAEGDAGMFRLSGLSLHFPKLGEVRAVVHRPLVGIPKRCTIRREVDQWFVAIQCEQDLPEPAPRSGPVVAIDRGLKQLLADSDGRLIENPKHLEKALRRLAHTQRIVARRTLGSGRCARAKLRVAKLHRTIRRQRAHALHVL